MTSTMTSTTPVSDRAEAVDRPGAAHPAPRRRVALGAQQPVPVPDHAGLAERERDEHARRCRAGSAGSPRPGTPTISTHGERGQEEDAVGERQPVAAGVQLAGQVAVLGQDRAEHREAVERGVRGQDQDQRGRRRPRSRSRIEPPPKTASRELGDDRLLDVARGRVRRTAPAGSSTILHVGQRASAMMPTNMVTDDAARAAAAWSPRCGSSAAGTPARRWLIASTPVSAVRPRRTRAAAGSTQRQPGERVALGRAMVEVRARRAGPASPRTQIADQPGDDHADDADHEHVRRDGERGARLAHAAQVHRGEQRDRDDRDEPPGARRRTGPPSRGWPRRRRPTPPPSARSRPAARWPRQPGAGPRLTVATS